MNYRDELLALRRRAIEELDSLGFFQYTNPSELEAAKRFIVETGLLFHVALHRYFLADAENIEEKYPEVRIEDLRQWLQRFHSIEIGEPHLEHERRESSYVASVDKWSGTIHTGTWQRAADDLAVWLSQVLCECGIPDRLWYWHAGNDTAFVLLTDEQAACIGKHGCFLEVQDYVRVDLPTSAGIPNAPPIYGRTNGWMDRGGRSGHAMVARTNLNSQSTSHV